MRIEIPKDNTRLREYYRQSVRTLTSIRGFISTLLLDKDGTMFSHSDRLELYQLIENECIQIQEQLSETHVRQWNELVPLRDLLRTYAVSTTHPLTCTVDTAVPEIPLVCTQPLGRIVMGLIEQAERFAPEGSALTLHAALQDTETLIFSLTHSDPMATPEFVTKRNEHLEGIWSGRVRVNRNLDAVRRGIPWLDIKTEGGRLWCHLGEGPTLVTCFTFPLADPLAAP